MTESARLDRRMFLAAGAAASMAGGAAASQETAMFGLIGKMNAVPGGRDALIEALVKGVSGMPGCLSYIVAKDLGDSNAIWVTEVWIDEASHKASLSLPSVQDAIRAGRPLIAGFGERFETAPVGGHGLIS